jgi:hypothetical protein
MRRILLICAAAVAFVSTAIVQPSSARAQEDCAPLSGTVFGAHENVGWTGTMLLAIARRDAETATFVDVNKTVQLDKLIAGKPFRGTEVLTATFADASTLVFDLAFIGVPAATPALYTLNETGDIVGGTGRFAGASGHVTIHGPFLSPVTVATPPWISEVHGVLCRGK